MHARVSRCRFKVVSLVAICTCILRLDAYSQALAHTNEPYRSEIWVGSSNAKLPEIKSDLEKIGGQMDERYELRVQQDADFKNSAEGKALKMNIDQIYSTKDVIEEGTDSKKNQSPEQQKKERERIAKLLAKNPMIRIPYFRPSVSTRVSCGGGWEFGDYEGRPVDWNKICPASEPFKKYVESVGLISAANHLIKGERQNIGTAFLVAANVVMTNKHVLYDTIAPIAGTKEERGKGSAWPLLADSEPQIDFAAEDCSPRGTLRASRIKRILFIDPKLDIALLEIEQSDSTPAPLILRRKPLNSTNIQYVAVVGFPCTPSRGDETRAAIFMGGKLQTRHLAPGVLVPPISPPFLRHDCTTIPGNSGSPLIDPTTGQVIGVHYHDDPANYEQRTGNLAVAMNAIAEDSSLSACGVKLNWAE